MIFRLWLYNCWFFFKPEKSIYADCRKKRTLAGDLAETKYVLFLTKIE